jgi:lipoprotein-anchoring transpeptidase ErfK/SrfK
MTANTVVDSDHDCDNDNINGKESKSATSVKVAKVVGLMQGIVQNPGDKKSRQNEEEVNTQPADGSEVRKRVLIAKRVDMQKKTMRKANPRRPSRLFRCCRWSSTDKARPPRILFNTAKSSMRP